jgi:UDP-glucuronate decarboxylase
MLDLARIIIEISESQSEILFEPLPTDDPDRRRPDISVARESLNWNPNISLEAGIQKTIASFRSRV